MHNLNEAEKKIKDNTSRSTRLRKRMQIVEKQVFAKDYRNDQAK